MNFTVTRSGFCKSCFQATRPLENDLYILFGTQHQEFSIHLCDHNAPFAKRGFVPFLFEKIGTQSLASGMFVHYTRTCGINNCGIFLQETKVNGMEIIAKGSVKDEGGVKRPFYIHRIAWKKGMMPESQWNALVNFKDTGFELDDFKHDP